MDHHVHYSLYNIDVMYMCFGLPRLQAALGLRLSFLEQGTPTDVLGFGCNWPAELHNKFLGIQADLYDVIEQSKERSQRERGYEQCHHPKLYDCRENNSLITFLSK